MMYCKVCGGGALVELGKPRIAERFLSHKLDKYTIVQCGSCGFYFMNPDIDFDQEQWRLIYEDSYFATDQSSWRLMLKVTECEKRLDYITDNYTNDTIRFLDMGCGEGYVLKGALARKWNTYGLDIANNLNQDIDRDKINYFCGNLFDAEYPRDHFDVIYMDSVLEHIDYPLDTLKELLRILKPGGIFFTIVPNEDCLENKMKKILYSVALKKHLYGVIKPFYPPFHIHGFNKKSIRTALELSSFEVMDVQSFGSNLPFWRGAKLFSRPYIQAMLLYPFGLLAMSIDNQVQLQILSRKPL